MALSFPSFFFQVTRSTVHGSQSTVHVRSGWENRAERTLSLHLLWIVESRNPGLGWSLADCGPGQATLPLPSLLYFSGKQI